MKLKATMKGPNQHSYVFVFLSVILWISALTLLQPFPDAYAGQLGGSTGSLGQFGFDDAVPDEVWQAARDGLEPFLDGIPTKNSEDYGFPQGSGFEDVSLKQPYRVMAIHHQELIDFNQSDDIRSILIETQMWMFPITQNGEPRAILMVDEMDGKPKAVLFGYVGLAVDLLKMEKVWSDEDGYIRTLVQIPQATSELLLITKDNLVEVQPLESARASLYLDEFDERTPRLYPAAEIVEELIPVVQGNIEHAKE